MHFIKIILITYNLIIISTMRTLEIFGPLNLISKLNKLTTYHGYFIESHSSKHYLLEWLTYSEPPQGGRLLDLEYRGLGAWLF